MGSLDSQRCSSLLVGMVEGRAARAPTDQLSPRRDRPKVATIPIEPGMARWHPSEVVGVGDAASSRLGKSGAESIASSVRRPLMMHPGFMETLPSKAEMSEDSRLLHQNRCQPPSLSTNTYAHGESA